MKNKKTFLVTGGTSFIGRNNVSLLLKKIKQLGFRSAYSICK